MGAPSLKMGIMTPLASFEAPSLREAVADWLLDADASVGNTVAGFLAQAAANGLVSGATVNRLVVMRNWVSDDRRSDAVIRAARQKGVGPAASISSWQASTAPSMSFRLLSPTGSPSTSRRQSSFHSASSNSSRRPAFHLSPPTCDLGSCWISSSQTSLRARKTPPRSSGLFLARSAGKRNNNGSIRGSRTAIKPCRGPSRQTWQSSNGKHSLQRRRRPSREMGGTARLDCGGGAR